MRNTMFPTASVEGIMLSYEEDHDREQPAPERFLWCAVLERAIDDLELRTKDHFCSFRWFLSDNVEMGSFLWVCFHLDISPDYVIRRLAPDLLKHLRMSR